MIILGTNSIKDTGYNVANSYRSNSGDSPKLSKTFSSASNSNTTFTVSAWVKRSKLGANQDVVSAFRSSDGLQTDLIRFGSGDDLEFYAHTTNSSGNADIQTNRLFRDVGAWYHIVVRVDTTQGTDTNRVRIYVNGVQETSFSTSNYMNQNGTIIWGLGSGTEHTIGAVGTSNYFGGYVAEVVYLDSQSVAPTTFGEFDDDSGIWKPIDVSGLTFGNNSFYLDFENSAELGTDASGNSHTFTENNIAATDQSTDTCTNNFCTMNPNLGALYTPTFTQGNLQVAQSTNNQHAVTHGTFAVTKGVWYWEVKYIGNTGSSGPSDRAVGIQVPNVSNVLTQATYNSNGSITYYGYDGGEVWDEGTATSADYGTYSQNSILGISLDMDNSHISFYINGTEVVDNYALGDYASVIATPAISWPNGTASGTEMGVNFGSPFYALSSAVADANGYGSFEYTPVGYALCTKNLAEYG